MKEPQNRNAPRRPKAAIDLAEVEKLAVIHATDQEIFDWYEGTIPRRMLESKKFRQAIERGRSRGRVLLRRLQFEAAQRDNPAMLSLLGAQWLGQQQTVGVQGSGPAKSCLPDWLVQAFKEDRATRNGGVQRSTVGESALDQSTKERQEPLSCIIHRLHATDPSDEIPRTNARG